MRILVIQHHKENRRKCTLTPLRDHPGLEVEILHPGPGGYPAREVEGGILLRVDAPPLSRADRALLDGEGTRLILVDANWVKVPRLLQAIRARGPLEPRSLPREVETAYPRRSKLFQDPPGGLATVEAIACALAILGEPDPSILEGYRWAERFRELNGDLFALWAPRRPPVTAGSRGEGEVARSMEVDSRQSTVDSRFGDGDGNGNGNVYGYGIG